MKSARFWLAAFAGGLVLNVLDFLLHGMILHSYYGAMPELFNPQGNPVSFILGDFVFALVVTWVYDRVYSSFGGGPKGGATYGFYAGVLTSFPVWFFMHLMFKGWPMDLSVIWTINGIVWGVILGAVIGAVYKKV